MTSWLLTQVAACTNAQHEILISWHEGSTLVGQIALTQDGCLQIADMNLRWIPGAPSHTSMLNCDIEAELPASLAKKHVHQSA